MSWIKNFQDRYPKEKQRYKTGLLAGSIGVFSNLILFIIKIIAGYSAQSISITADAMNSLSDGVSSLLTILGFYWASKPADKEHPYGHQRAEYISGFVVAIIIIIIGFQFLSQSIMKIMNPSAVLLSPLIFWILIFSAVFKLIQGWVYRQLAASIQSNTLTAVSKDSFNDVLMTSSIILSVLLEKWTGWHLDGYVGSLIAVYIIYSGFESIQFAISDLLGERPHPELTQQMVAILERYPKVLDYHDLDVHKYGPDTFHASIHLEVDAKMSLVHAHRLSSKIERDFLEELQIKLVSHVDPVQLDDPLVTRLHYKIKKLLRSYDEDYRFHDLHLLDRDKKEPRIIFDVVVPEGESLNNDQLYGKIVKDIHTFAPDTKVEINFDRVYLLKDLD